MSSSRPPPRREEWAIRQTQRGENSTVTCDSCPSTWVGKAHRRNVRHTTHHQDLPERVTIVRAGHPFEGKSLAVLRAIHRHGRLYLLLILPDGSKSLIPADWTDIAPTVLPLGAIAERRA